MTEKTLTTENIRPALDALRGELAPWPVVAKKQDRLNTAQLNAANSGITSSLVAQIIANTAAIRALESAITGTGLRALVVASLPAVGTTGILYIVPVTTYDPDTDADVVNYSNEYIWIPVEGGQASEGHYEQVGQTGIVINNGQLTITVNGTSVGTFTANQSGDTTSAITVPTNADYVDRTTDQTVAGVKTFSSTINGTAAKAIADEDGTSIKTGYVNVSGNQTVSGQKTWSGNQFFTSAVYHKSTTYEIGNIPASNIVTNIYFADKNNVYTGFTRSVIYASGRTATELRAKNLFKNSVLDPTGSEITSSLNVEVQPNGTKTIYWDGLIRNDVTPYTTNNNSLGSSTNQWSSVYAQTYYYNGVAWGLDKANVWTNTQTYSAVSYGEKIRFQNTGLDLSNGNPAVSSICQHIIWWDDKNNTHYAKIQSWANDTNGTILLSSYYRADANTVRTSTLRNQCGATSKSFFPESDSDTDLGTSTNKWKTLNGINPGALSLPDVSNAVSIDTTDWDKTGNLISYTPPVDGWISIITDNSSAANYIRCAYDNGDILAKANGNGYAQGLSVFLPVPKNTQVAIRLVCTTINTAKLYPCLGNV